MIDERKTYRATRTTPDPYPPEPVLVKTDKDPAQIEGNKLASVGVKYLKAPSSEMATGNELSDFVEVDLTVPAFQARLLGVDETVLIYSALTMAEAEAAPSNAQLEFSHVEGGVREIASRSQLVDFAEVSVSVKLTPAPPDKTTERVPVAAS